MGGGVLSYTFSSAAGLSATQQEPAAHKGQAKESYACCALSKGPWGGATSTQLSAVPQEPGWPGTSSHAPPQVSAEHMRCVGAERSKIPLGQSTTSRADAHGCRYH
jgi:hypothetical protein